MTAQSNRTALIIGASRGLGLALAEELLARDWSVIATVRGAKHTALHGKAAASRGRLSVEQLEMTDPDAVRGLRERLAGQALEAKRLRTIEERGLDFLDATRLFDGRLTLSAPAMFGAEQRFLTVALLDGKFHTVVWTWA